MNIIARKRPARASQTGYTLVNVMLLLAGMAVVATLQFRDQAFKYETQKATIAGQQMRLLNDGIEGYLAAHTRSLASMSDNDCYGAASCAPTQWYCAPIGSLGNQCSLNLSRLVVEGFLPQQWVNLNAWGSSYQAVVSRVLKPNAVTQGNPQDYNLRVITVTQTPWQDASGRSLMGLVGQAVKAGGSDMAMTSDPANINQASGLARRTYSTTGLNSGTLVTWGADNSMNPWINGAGQLVARAGFESTAGSAFPDLLKRDGSRPMKNSLDMGQWRVNNAQDAYVKKISGGRNLAAITPTWVFKYSWRVAYDGAVINKPDCSAESGGWTNRTGSSDPWAPSYIPGVDANKSYDRGEPRILVVNDTLRNLKSLGYYQDPAGACADGLTNTSPASTTSCPANESDDAYDPAFRTRAKAAYQFYAEEENATAWRVHMRYYQDGSSNVEGPNGGAATDAQGIASVYCYYDNRAASACNGEAGCVSSGATGGGSAAPDLSSAPEALSVIPYQSPLTSGSSSQVPVGTGNPGAGDVTTTF